MRPVASKCSPVVAMLAVAVGETDERSKYAINQAAA